MNYYVNDRPAGCISPENPARFTWMPGDEDKEYRIEVKDRGGNCRYVYEGIDCNFYTPDHVMEPGHYTYSVFSGDRPLVSGQSFQIPEDAAVTPLPGRAQRYRSVGCHPRLWLDQEEIKALAGTESNELKAVRTRFLDKGVRPWLNREVTAEPVRYPGDERVIRLWRQMYLDCQEAFYAVKHCAVAWKVTGEEQYLRTARKWLLALAGWDPDGSTARSYNDEAAFRVTAALAWGYDWLSDDLSEAERAQVKKVLLYRAGELYDYVRNQIRIHIKLLDSHGVRSLSMALAPAALALLTEEGEAKEWLDFIIEYFFSIFSPWGGEDGGWAEGPAYWQSGVSFFTEANCLIRKALGIDVFQRPFFQNTGDFILNTYCQDTRFMAFGDMSDLGDYPGMKAGYTMRILSAVTQSPNRRQYAWYYEQAKKRGQGTEGLFYNYGWWSFEFDELFFLTLFEAPPAEAPPDKLLVRWFKDVGWVCIHQDMADEKKHLAFMFKSSPYGSVSHSHGDQNGFVLHAFGRPLAIQSGYYVGFWSEMHTKWRRMTKSKNAVLIDHQGQFAEMRKTTKAEEMNGSAKTQFDQLISARGNIEVCEQRDGYVYIRGDAAAAYARTVPYLKKNKRHVLFLAGQLFVIIDEIELERQGTVQWLLHGLHKFNLYQNSFESRQGDAGLYVCLAGGEYYLEQTDVFDGVDPAETEGLPPQWHVTAATAEPGWNHRIIAVLYPYAGEPEELPAVLAGDEIRVRFGGRDYEIVSREDGSIICE